MYIIEAVNNRQYAKSNDYRNQLLSIEVSMWLLSGQPKREAQEKYIAFLRQYGAVTKESYATLALLAKVENRDIITDGSLQYLDNGIAQAETKMDTLKAALTLTVDEVATALGLSKPTVYRLVNEDESFPAFRVGKKILVSRTQLVNWVDQQCSKGVLN